MKARPSRRLGDLTKILSGFAFDSEGFNDSEGLPLVRIRDVVPGTTSTFYRGDFDSAYIVGNGDILIGMDGEFNRSRWRGGKALLNQRVCRISPTSPELDEAYLFHFLPLALKAIENVTPFVTVKHLSVKQIRDIHIPLPSPPEQRRIAEILDKADALQAKRRAALAQLDTLTQSIFLDMFGDPATNPKGWPVKPLITVLEDAEVFVDGDWVESKDQDPEGEVRLIQLADIGDGAYLDKSARFLTKETSIRLKCTPLKVGDVLVARMPDPLGRACIFPGDKREAVTVVDVCIIRPGADGPNPVWLMCAINTRGFRGLIARQATGTTRERISRGNLAKLPLIMPPGELQSDFAQRVNELTTLRAVQNKTMGELDVLFASLQSRAFTGEL